MGEVAAILDSPKETLPLLHGLLLQYCLYAPPLKWYMYVLGWVNPKMFQGLNAFGEETHSYPVVEYRPSLFEACRDQNSQIISDILY